MGLKMTWKLVHYWYNVNRHCSTQLSHSLISVQGTIVSVLSIGAVVGALVSGLMSDLAGRKVSVIIGASTCAVGGTLQASSFYLWSGSFTITCLILLLLNSTIGCCCQDELLVELESGMKFQTLHISSVP